MNTIKIGCGWWGFREKPLDEHFTLCKKWGFKTLEVGIGDEFQATIPMNSTGGQLEAIKEKGRTLGISTPFATIENDFTLPDAQQHQRMVDHAVRALTIASRLGITHIRIFAGFMPASDITAGIYQQVTDAFKTCHEVSQPLGIRISIETHGKIEWKNGVAFHHPTISTDPSFLEKLLRDLPEEIGFNYDPGNLKAAHPEDRRYALDLLNGRINYCHLKDWRPEQGGWVAAAIGDDDLDYAELLPRIKFDGIYLIEYEPLEDLEAGIQRSLDYLHRIGYSLQFK